jgi:hypothetical protein
MSTWFYKSLGDAIVAAQPSDQIREAFLSSYESLGKPAGMAVFTRSDSVDRLHCEVSVYFSPAAAEVAKVFDAKPCERPLRPGLELLAGDRESWPVLFPQS